MKESFKAFYQASNDELKAIWQDNNTIFVFDTNVLLNLYAYSTNARNEFFQVLDKISDRLWLPFHVGLEFQKNRLNVIKSEKSVFTNIQKNLQDFIKTVDDDFSINNLKNRNPELFSEKEKFKNDLENLINKFSKKVLEEDEKQMSVNSGDKIRERLDSLFEGRIGKDPDQKWISKIEKEGKERFDKKIPPSYKDKNKSNSNNPTFSFNGKVYERQFGDLFIWKQLIDFLHDSNYIENVVFITDDAKEDWWQIIDSRGKKIIDIRFELKSEIYKETNIKSFKIYQTNSFLNDAKKYISLDIEDEVITETEEVSVNNTTKELQDSKLLTREEILGIRENLDRVFNQNNQVKPLNPDTEILEMYKRLEKLKTSLKAVYQLNEKSENSIDKFES